MWPSKRMPGLPSFGCTSMLSRTTRHALVAVVCLAFAVAPAPAMVGGAPPAEQALARHVVLIVGAQSLCSGVAIAPDLVLTAAHCVLDNGKYRLVTFEGRRASVREVAAVASHPQFSARADAPDIALVKLAATPAPNLVPAALSERRAPPAVGGRLIAARFGGPRRCDSNAA